MLEKQLKATIRDIPDFPRQGIIFKDIMPVLQDSKLCREVLKSIKEHYQSNPPEAIIAIESRGFFFGMLLAMEFNIPFVPVRKKGKLPYKTISRKYDLEYGQTEIEMHVDAIKAGQNVMIHDDLLATGGTASAAAELVKELGGKIHSFTFIVELEFLKGRQHLLNFTDNIFSLIKY